MASRLRFVPWPDKTETLRKDHKQSIYIHFAFIASVEGSCCKLTPVSGKYNRHFNFVFFLYFSYHSSSYRKDQFTALILKFGIITQKKSNTGLRVDLSSYSPFSLKDSLQWSENWTRLIPEEQTG